MSECLCENGKLPPSEALAKHDDNGSSLRRVCERSTKQEGDPEGEAGSPCGLLEKYAARRGVTQPAQTSLAAWQWHAARSGGRALR